MANLRQANGATKRWAIAMALAVLGVGGGARTGWAQLAVVANDHKLVLVAGVQTVVKNPAPDTVTIIDLGAKPPKVVAEIEGVPCSVIGPPLSVAVTPDESLALVTASMKVDPKDPTKQTEDNRISVIDLKATPPKVIATLEAGKAPAGISVNRAGTMALVANRADGCVTILSIKGKTVAVAGKVQIGDAAQALAHVAFTPDGKRALVTRDGENLITVLNINGEKVTLAGRDMRSGIRPYGLEISGDGKMAVVANVGGGGGDIDTIGVLDLQANPPRGVDVIAVGVTPEGIKLSPDGKWCAVIVHEGTGRAKDSPFYHDAGKLILFRVEGTKLLRTAEAPIGHWSQGIAFSADEKTILVGNMVENNVQVFSFDGTALKDTGQKIATKGGPVAMRTAEK